MQAIWSASQIQGGRDYQEDFLAVIENDTIFSIGKKQEIVSGILPAHQSLYLLADGMGGMGHGDIAASAVIDVFLETFISNLQEGLELEINLRNALNQANQKIANIVEEHPERDGMGCTLIALFWDSQIAKIHWLSVGDSLLGIQREGKWEELNEKHIWSNLAEKQRAIGKVLDEGEIDAISDALYSAVDGSELNGVDIAEVSVLPNDIVIVASDGLEVLSPEKIQNVVKSCIQNLNKNDSANEAFNNIDAIRQQLFSDVTAEENHNQDNTSVIVIGFFEGLN